MFVPDKQRHVTCIRTCAAIWPPVKLATGAKPVAAGRAKASLLGSDPNPAGGRVVTYHGWPLYTYVTDTRAREATGQALNLNGGLWYVLAPSGQDRPHEGRLMASRKPASAAARRSRARAEARSPSQMSSPRSPDRPMPFRCRGDPE